MTIRRILPGLIALAVTVSAQTPQPAPPPEQRPIFRAEANLVRVDVHVIAGGKPLTGLTAADFELLENGAPQKIDRLEYVRVEAPRSAPPIEPRSSAQAWELAADPRNRLFVLFLDEYFVTQENSLHTPVPLVRTIDSLIAPTDLLGVMTPTMRVSDLVLGRKTDVIRRGLLDNQRWGRMLVNCREQGNLDQIEKMFSVCYPSLDPKCDLSSTALHLIRRRRAAFTFGALRDLVRYVGATRAARTAILLVTEGWPLAMPSEPLAQQGAEKPPELRILPGGRIGTNNPNTYNVNTAECAQHLREAAFVDHDRAFRDLMDEANRHNTSFYVVDPAGLRTGASDIDPQPGQIPAGGRVELLRTLAENTDGTAIVDTNDLSGTLRRAMADLSGYYLIGYYSTNTTFDGSYRSIDVKVRRPGVDVRARKGYRAWTAADVKAMNETRAAVAAAPVDAATVERTTALGRLARLSPATVFFLHASLDPLTSELYVTGELGAAASKSMEWRQGGDAQIMITGPDGSPAGSNRATIAPGGRSFLARVPVSRAAAGDYEVAVRLKPAGGSTPLLETRRVSTARPGLAEPVAFRSADRHNPVASFFWWRTEIARFEAPVSQDADTPTARILDRAGNPMPVPVDVSIRDESGSRWLVADLKLAPLSPGDYLVELTARVGGAMARRYAPLRVER